MELTPQQREAIYLEEKAKREKTGSSGYSEILLISNVIAAIALIGIIVVSKNPGKMRISIDAIRQAYSGLSPDDMQ